MVINKLTFSKVNNVRENTSRSKSVSRIKFLSLVLVTAVMVGTALAMPFTNVKASNEQSNNSFRFRQVVSGESHTLALTYSGELYGWGSNSYGQLGLSDTNINYTVPTKLEFANSKTGYPAIINGATGNRIVKIVAASNTSLMLLETGEAIAFGRADENQTGSLNSAPAIVNLANNESYSYLFYDIAAGENHFLLQGMDRGGNILIAVLGDNSQNQILYSANQGGLGEVLYGSVNPKDKETLKSANIFAGGNSTAIAWKNTSEESGVIAFGGNDYGNLGVGENDATVPLSDGSQALDNKNLNEFTTKIDRNIITASSTPYQSFADSLHTNQNSVLNTALATGFIKGATDTGTRDNEINSVRTFAQDTANPYELGGQYSLIKPTGGETVYGMGRNSLLPIADNSGNSITPIEIPALEGAKDFAINKSTAIASPSEFVGSAITSTNTVIAWTEDNSGNYQTITLTGGATPVSISSSYSGTFYVLDSLGRIYPVNASSDISYPIQNFHSLNSVPSSNLSVINNISSTLRHHEFTTTGESKIILSVSEYATASGTVNLLQSNNAFQTGVMNKIMTPVNDSVVSGGTARINDEGDWDNRVAQIVNYNALDAESQEAVSYANQFRLVYMENGVEVSDVYASRFFSIEFKGATAGTDIATSISNNSKQTIEITSKRSMGANWTITVLGCAYDMGGNAYDKEFYYAFVPITFTINQAINRDLTNANILYDPASDPAILDPNSTNTRSFTATNVVAGYGEFITHLTNNSASFNDNTLKSQFETEIGYASGDMFTPIAKDPDGDILRFLSVSTNTPEYVSVSKEVVTREFVIVPTTKSVQDIVNEFVNTYGFDVKVKAGTNDTIIVSFEYIKLLAHKTRSSNQSIIVVLTQYYSATDTAEAKFSNSFSYTIDVESKASITFLNYDQSTDLKNNIGIGLNTVRSFGVATKTRGDFSPSAQSELKVGDVAVVNIDQLFADATQLEFVTNANSTTGYLDYLADADLFKITLNSKTIEIEAYNRFSIKFKIEVKNLAIPTEDHQYVNFTITATDLATDLQIRKVENFSKTIDTTTTLSPTDLFRAGFQNTDEPQKNSGNNTNIRIISAVSATPSLATVRVTSDNKLVITPTMDGRATILVTGRFFSYSASAQTFSITVTNCTVFSQDLKFNGRQQLPIIDLKTELAYSNTENPSAHNAFISNLDIADSVTGAMFSDAVMFKDEVAQDAVQEITETSNIVSVVYSTSLQSFILDAKLVGEYDETVMYVKFRHRLTDQEYNIQVNIRSTHKTLIKDGMIKTFSLGKDSATFTAEEFAVGMGFAPTDYTTIRIDFIRMGDIMDEQLNDEDRFTVVHTSRTTEFTLQPNRDGVQMIYFIVYSENNLANEQNANGLPIRYLFEAMVEVDGITTTLTAQRYGMAFLIGGVISFFVLFIIFLVRFGIYTKKRAEQKKIIKRNEMLIKMRDKMHQNASSINKQKIVNAKLKMQDKRYAKMADEMRRDRTVTRPSVQLEPNTFAMGGTAVVTTPTTSASSGGKKKKKKKNNLEQMRAELEAKKAQMASMQGTPVEVPLDERSEIDEQIKARMGDDLLDLDI